MEIERIADPVDLRLRIPGGPGVIIQVERTIMEWLGGNSAEGHGVGPEGDRNPSRPAETLTEWFIRTLRVRMVEDYNKEIERGADPESAAGIAGAWVQDAHAPTMFIIRVLELRSMVKGPERVRRNLMELCVRYLAAHPVHLANLADLSRVKVSEENYLHSLGPELRQVIARAQRQA